MPVRWSTAGSVNLAVGLGTRLRSPSRGWTWEESPGIGPGPVPSAGRLRGRRADGPRRDRLAGRNCQSVRVAERLAAPTGGHLTASYPGTGRPRTGAVEGPAGRGVHCGRSPGRPGSRGEAELDPAHRVQPASCSGDGRTMVEGGSPAHRPIGRRSTTRPLRRPVPLEPQGPGVRVEVREQAAGVRVGMELAERCLAAARNRSAFVTVAFRRTVLNFRADSLPSAELALT
jgi:hypothetical protein